jgi:U3 small nucleolar RNA-associated protein 25
VSSERPYATLMKSFTAKSSVHAVKRRKLNRNQEPKSNQVDKDGTLTVVDEVEEPEEGPETATEGLLEEDNDELIDVSDPFEAHFADPDDNVLAERLKTVNKQQWSTRKVFFPEVGNALVSIPAEHDTLLHPSLDGPSQLRLKSRLATLTTKIRPSFDALERTLAPFVFGYQDVLYCERTVHTAESLQRLVCLHAVNHIFK